MAITRLWQGGMELGHINELPASRTGASVQTDTVYTGTYSVRFTTAGPGLVIPATRQIRIGAFIYGQSIGGWSNPVCIMGASAAGGAMITLFKTYQSNSGGYISYRQDFTNWDSCINTFENAWHHYVFDTKVDPSAGWCYVYKDGLPILTYDGNTGDVDIELARFGNWFNGDATSNARWDDIYVEDTTGESSPVPGPLKRFYFIKPDGDGNYSQWASSSGSGADHYADIDEVPPSETDYLESDSPGQKDSHTMTTFTLDTNEEIKAIIPIAYGERFGAVEQLALGTRLSSADEIGSAQTLPSQTPGYLWERQAAKPGGGDWEQADLDAVEVVIESSGSF